MLQPAGPTHLARSHALKCSLSLSFSLSLNCFGYIFSQKKKLLLVYDTLQFYLPTQKNNSSEKLLKLHGDNLDT